MRVCFLSSIHPPLDKRVFAKEAVSLARNGFDVVHLAPDGSAREWKQDTVRIATYERGHGWWGRVRHLPRLYRLASRQKADCYHCNEVDSWLVGALLKLTRRTRIVFDVHEHYPSDFAERLCPPLLRPIGPTLIRLGFQVLAPFTDGLVFAKKHISSDFPRSIRRQIVVENFASLAYCEIWDSMPDERKRTDSGVVTAIHLGGMSKIRGWPQMLDALARARSKELRISLVGAFPGYGEPDFDRQRRELGLQARVSVEPWLPFREAYERVLRADIGLVLFQPGVQNHVLALPHKMFDYMLAGLPVIAPRFAIEVAEIVKDADCGILVDSSDPDEIASAFDRLVMDADERRRLGQNGRTAVLTRYNWEREAEKLVEMYRDLCAELSPAKGT
jgi:glycosyltransferase involved in cell wall biosynthesis